MGRDDAIYELCKADARIFFPGSHSGRADAVRLLLADGWSVTWNDRPNGLRTRCGFIRITNPEDLPVEIDGPEIARGIKVEDPRDAWEILVRAPALDPVFLGGLTDRLVERGPGPNRAFVPLAA